MKHMKRSEAVKQMNAQSGRPGYSSERIAINLYLIEYYTTDEAIQMAWVRGRDAAHAKEILAGRSVDFRGQAIKFNEVIQTSQVAEIVPLAMKSVPIFLA